MMQSLLLGMWQQIGKIFLAVNYSQSRHGLFVQCRHNIVWLRGIRRIF